MSLPECIVYRSHDSDDTWIHLEHRISSGAEVWARSLTLLRGNAGNIIREIDLAVIRRRAGVPSNCILEASYTVVLAVRPMGVRSDKARREG